VLILARTRYEEFVLPQLVNVRGISERTWERKRPIWEGDVERERNPPKRARTKSDGDADQDGDQSMVDGEHSYGEHRDSGITSEEVAETEMRVVE
jgi:hypothetical protein